MAPYDMPMHDEPDGDEPEMGPEGDAAEGSSDKYALAGRTIRHALADGDDTALAEAVCHLIDIHTGGGGEEPQGPKEKPNLALLLMGKKKKD